MGIKSCEKIQKKTLISNQHLFYHLFLSELRKTSSGCQVVNLSFAVFGRVVGEACRRLPLQGDFLAGVLDDPVAALSGVADSLESQLLHEHTYLLRVERLPDAAVDFPQHLCRGDENALLVREGGPEVAQDEVALQVRRLKFSVVLVQYLQFPGIEPVSELVFPQVYGLAVDAGIIHRMLLRRVDTFHLKRQPAPVAAGVAEKVGIVAGGAEAGDARAVFLVSAVGWPFIHGFQRHHGFQLVQCRRIHLVYLFQADEHEFRQAEEVVLGVVGAAHLGVEVGPQFGWQQVVEPRGLVAALRPDEHQDFVVDGIFPENRGQHSHQPFAQVFGEQFLVALDVYGGSQPGDVVRGAVPGRQVEQIVLQRVVNGHIFRVQQVVDVGRADASRLFAHAQPQRVLVAVGQGSEAGARGGGVVGGIGYFALSRKHIVAEVGL